MFFLNFSNRERPKRSLPSEKKMSKNVEFQPLRYSQTTHTNIIFLHQFFIFGPLCPYSIPSRYLHIKKGDEIFNLGPRSQIFFTKGHHGHIERRRWRTQTFDMRSRSPVCCHLPSPLIMIYILLYTYTPAIDLVLIAYLDSMTMTSFNIFKARVVIFKKLKVNAKMQIEHGCWLWVVLLDQQIIIQVNFIYFLYYRSFDAKS